MTVRRALRIAAGAALAATVALLGLPAMWVAVRVHPHFTLREVTVTGVRTVAAGEIRRAAGLVPAAGVSVWDVDLEAVRARVLLHPWVARAAVVRRLPGAVRVHVHERRPAAALVLERATYAVDRDGRVFAPLRAADADRLPRITGIRAADFDVGDEMSTGAVRRALALMRVLRATHPVIEVRVDRTAGLTAVTDDLGLPIHVGWGRWQPRLRRLDQVLALWRGREGEIEAVSVAIDGQVVVRPRAGRPLAGGAAVAG